MRTTEDEERRSNPCRSISLIGFLRVGVLVSWRRCPGARGTEEDDECWKGMGSILTLVLLATWGQALGGSVGLADEETWRAGPWGRDTQTHFFKGKRDILPPSYNINIFRFS